MRTSGFRRSVFLAAAVALMSSSRPCPAQEPAVPNPADAPGPTDAGELASFLDGFFTTKMAELHIPGAAFVLVREGRVILARGYGDADIGAHVRVDPGRTVFRLGSVSKLVTATAVMQLVERGTLRLDDDVNKHLRHFRVADIFPAPVTVADLLTHTGGFDERHIGMHARTAAEFVPLGDFLARRLPPRVLPPATIIAYSDFGMSLAGHIVEVATNTPFASYVEENIFRPLGMASSSIEQPMPPDLMARLATGYGWRKGHLVPYPYVFAQVAPAAALQGTALDMAAFMIAHLEGGRAGAAPILAESTLQEMHRRHASHHPRLRGRAYGFSEWIENGQRALFHDGAMPGYMSRVFLLPAHRLGFFVAINADQFSSAGAFPRALTSEFLKRYFPAPASPPPLVRPADFAARAGRFTGSYRSLHEYSRHTLEKVMSLGEQVVAADPHDGTLAAFGSRLVEVDPMLFRWQDGASFVAFAADTGGKVERMFVGTGAYEKLAWYETRLIQLGLALALALCFIAAPIGALRGAAALGPAGRGRLALFLVAAISLLNLTALAGTPLAIAALDRWEFLYGLPGIVAILLALPLVAAGAAAVLLAAVVRAWLQGTGSRFARIWCTALLAMELALLGWLHYWNLLGYRT